MRRVNDNDMYAISGEDYNALMYVSRVVEDLANGRPFKGVRVEDKEVQQVMRYALVPNLLWLCKNIEETTRGVASEMDLYGHFCHADKGDD